MNLIENAKDLFTDWKAALTTGLLQFLILPTILVDGFIVRLCEKNIQREKGLPNYSEILKFLKQGLIFRIIQFLYLLPVILLFIILSFLIPKNISPLDKVSAVPFYVFLLAILILILLFLVWLLFPFAIVLYAENMTFEDAFNFNKIFSFILIKWKSIIVIRLISILLFFIFLFIIPFLNLFSFIFLAFQRAYIYKNLSSLYSDFLNGE